MLYHVQYNDIPSVIAFFPNVRGVGFSYFKPNKEHYHSGMITTRDRFNNSKYIQRIKECLDLYTPETIILEEYRKSKGSVKTKRIAELIRDISRYAKQHNITVVYYKRSNVRDVFSNYNLMKKHDIAQLICVWIPSLEQYMYAPRKEYKMEPYSSALFEAVSLCVTWFYLEY